MTNFQRILGLNLLVLILSTNICFSFPVSSEKQDTSEFIWLFGDQLCEIPFQTTGVTKPLISLNGEWKFCSETNQINWDESGLKWNKIIVPGEPAMQGCSVKHNIWYAYRKTIDIPQDYSGKNVVLRFNGVYGQAKVWVNGKYLREHQGGFTSWECDLTPYVKAGEKASLVVAFCDRLDDISYASGYAHHPVGGILRNVELIALHETFISELYTETTFDDTFTNCMLSVHLSAKGVLKGAKIKIRLNSPNGDPISMKNNEIDLDKTANGLLQNSILEPEKWDAEHPNLYELTADISLDGKIISSVRKKVGFRQIEVKDDQLLVNGKPIKLRGACRHDINPLMGRSTTDEYDLKDVLLAKEANFNFIRTSHYPPSGAFLDYCDKYGIYVEEETAVCFVSTHRSPEYKQFGASQNDTAFTSLYLGQLAEMIERDRNNPSVIIWSLGNESEYGSNFRKESDYIKMTDKSRPVMFSYPGTTGNDKIYDIMSMHYVSYEGNLSQSGLEIRNFSYPGISVMHDEWAHIPCYNAFTLSSDPEVNDFWGESMDKMWSGCFTSKGGLGGAIWGMIDETFMLPDTCVGYGQWGIVDTWRRRKPEFWNAKKAYSPVRLEYDKDSVFAPGKDIVLDLFNRFDQTNISEVKIICNGKTVLSPSILPHVKGNLTIPGNLVLKGKPVDIAFYSGEMMIDRYLINTGTTQTVLPAVDEKNAGINVVETTVQVEVSGERFKVTFNKQSGLISSAFCKGSKIIDNGPYLTLVSKASSLPSQKGDELVETAGKWKLTDFHFQKTDSVFTAIIQGTSGIYPVEFIICINGNGEIITSYKVENNPETVHEVGIYYNTDKGLDKLQWNRNAYWSYYPKGHLGRPQGIALKLDLNSEREQYRIPHSQNWESDSKDFFLFQKTGKRNSWFPVTNDFRSSKLNILTYSLTNQTTGTGILVISDGRLSARSEINADGSVKLILLDKISYDDLDWGNYEQPDNIERPYNSTVNFFLIRNYW